MARFNLIANLGLVLEYYNLVASVLRGDLCANRGSFHGWGANRDLSTIGYKQNSVEFNRTALFPRNLLDSDGFARLSPVLFAARLDDCVGHFFCVTPGVQPH